MLLLLSAAVVLAPGLSSPAVQASADRTSRDVAIALNPPDLLPEGYLVHVVTPTRENTPLLESPTSVKVITRQSLETAGIRTVGDALSTLAADVQYVEGGVSPFYSVRGYGSSSNFNERELILLDGQPLNDAALATFDLHTIPTSDVDHIEIVAGPGSALYGPDAFGGVVNIITRRPQDITRDTGDVYAGSGVFALEGVAAGSMRKPTGGRGPISWSFSGLYNRDPGITAVPNGDQQTGSVRARALLPHGLDLAAGYYSADTGSVGYAFQGPPTPHNRIQSHLTTVRLDWTPLLGTTDTRVRFYGEGGDETAVSELPVGSGHFSYLRANPGTYGVEAQSHLSQGKPGSLLVGMDLRRNTSGGDIDHQASDLAAFAQEELHLGKLTPNFGVRYDYHSVYGGRLSPRLAAIYELSPRAYLRASLGTAYRAPNFTELFVPAYVVNRQPPFPVPPIPIVITGNSELKPEDTTAAEIGLRASLGAGLTLDAAAFSDRVNNLISFLITVPPPPPGTGPGGTWANTGSGTIRGVDLTLTHPLGANARTSLEYLYLDANRLSLNRPNAVALSGTAPHHSVTWQTYLEHFHGMSAAFILNARSASESRGGAAIADLTLGRALRPWLSVQLIAHNLLDTRYEAGQTIPGNGRTVFARISGSIE